MDILGLHKRFFHSHCHACSSPFFPPSFPSFPSFDPPFLLMNGTTLWTITDFLKVCRTYDEYDLFGLFVESF